MTRRIYVDGKRSRRLERASKRDGGPEGYVVVPPGALEVGRAYHLMVVEMPWRRRVSGTMKWLFWYRWRP